MKQILPKGFQLKPKKKKEKNHVNFRAKRVKGP